MSRSSCTVYMYVFFVVITYFLSSIVVGFNMNHTKFRDDYFINPSIQVTQA